MKLSEGISKVSYTTGTGENKSKVEKLRLRINRKGIKVDKLFELHELSLAIEYRKLALAGKLKSEPQNATKKVANSLTHEYQRRAIAEMQEFWNDSESFHYFCQLYIDSYVNGLSEEDERDRRNKHGILGFLNRIQLVLVPDRQYKDEQIRHKDTEFGKIPVLKIGVIDINNYVKSRIRAGLMSSSIQRELSFINNVLMKLPHLDERFEEVNYESPVKRFDRSLLKANPADRKKQVLPEITSLDTTRLMEIIRAGKSSRKGEVEAICMLSACTGMRRGECVYLRADQINYDLNYIWLTKTKSKKPRKVYFDATAKAFLQSLPVQKDGRFFTISVTGFDRLTKGYIKKFNETSPVKFTFHMFRKLYISKTISRIGVENSLYAGQFLGLSSKWVEKLGEHTEQTGEIRTQKQMLRSIGHSNPRVTENHYMLGLDFKQKAMMVEELKAKRLDGSISPDERNLLLELLLESQP